jgi:hypothetical protein
MLKRRSRPAASDDISEANADYNIPGVVSEGYNTLAADWVGIGSGTSSTDPLIQAGSVSIWEETIPPAHPDYWFFAEVAPGLDIKEVNLAGLGAPQPNHTVRITVEYQSSTVAAMNIEYDDNGTWYSGGLTFGVGGQGGASTAEYIVEDPCILGELWALSEYGVVPFWDADYTYKSNLESAVSDPGPGGSLVALNMTDKAGGIVSETTFPSSGYPFEVIREGSADAVMGTCPNPL